MRLFPTYCRVPPPDAGQVTPIQGRGGRGTVGLGSNLPKARAGQQESVFRALLSAVPVGYSCG